MKGYETRIFKKCCEINCGSVEQGKWRILNKYGVLGAKRTLYLLFSILLAWEMV
jgi:hypothetical protein